MKIKGTRRIKLSELVTDLFVRQALDQDHVAYLMDLVAAGVQFKDKIQMTIWKGRPIIVDGRHRKEAYELNDVTEAEVTVLEFDSEIEMIAYAYCANSGGSLPPSIADTEHTVMMLVDRNESMKRIADMLRLPTSLVRKYVANVKAKAARQKLAKAAAAVTDGGLTVAKAAEQHEVEVDQLKELLSGRRKKQHKNGIEETHRNLTVLYKSLGSKNASLFRKLSDMLEDGDVTLKQVNEIIAHTEQLQRRSSRALADWKARFQTRTTTLKSVK